MSIRVKSVAELSNRLVLVHRCAHKRVVMVYFHKYIYIYIYLTTVQGLWIIGLIKTTWIRWAGHVVRMGERRGLYSFFVGKPEGKKTWGKRLLGKPRRRWEDNINTLWTGDADLRLCITTVEDGWSTSAFLTRAWFPRTINFNYAIHADFLRMVLLTDVYRNVIALRSNDLW